MFVVLLVDPIMDMVPDVGAILFLLTDNFKNWRLFREVSPTYFSEYLHDGF